MKKSSKHLFKTGLHAHIKLWIASENTGSGFGDGKWRLLQAIQREGSLKSATAVLGISYRKAWGDLKKAEACLGVRLIEKHRGGSEGGETRLTKAGQRWVTAYGRMHARMEAALAKEFAKQIEGFNP